LPDGAGNTTEGGSCTSVLVSTDYWQERVNAMPMMTAIPVQVTPVNPETTAGVPMRVR
jgi:hypothetical protein